MRFRYPRLAFLLSALLLVTLVRMLVPPSQNDPGRRFDLAQRAMAQGTAAKPGQAVPATAPAQPADPSAGIEVTAQALLPSKFCAYGANAYVVYVPMDITIANGRRTPIILTKQLLIQRFFLGKTQEDVLARKYELATAPRPLHTSGIGVPFSGVPSDDFFTLLKHNQTYDFTAIQGIQVRNNAADKIADTIYPGSFFLSVELQTWPYFRDPSQMQRDWAGTGDLISTPVLSYPTIVRLPANPVVEKCGITPPGQQQQQQ